MIINGSDYTLVLIAALSFVVPAVLEYMICAKAKNEQMRKVLLFVPFLVWTAGLIRYGKGGSSGGFIDLSSLVLVVFAIWGLICLVGIAVGWVAYRLKEIKIMNEARQNCPLSEENNE